MIKAVIFDMDGVISDTQKVHSAVEEKILNGVGIKITAEEMTERYSGVPDNLSFKEISDENNVKFDVYGLVEKKWKTMVEEAEKGVDSVPGINHLLEWLKEKNIRMCVASSSRKHYVEAVIKNLNLASYFECLITGEDVERGKPEPDIFLLAAKRMGVEPKDCVVIEDSKNGIEAANRAGMKSIAFIEEKRKESANMNDYKADFIVNNLTEIEKLKGLF